jgi:zinc transport system ATP-binding protein
MTDAIHLDHVSFAYDARPVLDNVSMRVASGTFACVVGPNGGGKSTLLRLLLGLLRPDTGRVEVLGGAPGRTRTRIGYVPQDFTYDRQFPIRVADVVGMGRLGRKPFCLKRSRADEDAVLAALDRVDMADASNQWFSRLSGGQRQRVLIARALATEPDMLLLDEPTANVDANAEEKIISVLERLRGDLTVLLVTHSAPVASRFLETCYCVNRTLHLHPHTDSLDAGLMRHLLGFEMPGESCAHGEDGHV